MLRITKGSNGSFLDLARRIVAFPFFWESSEWKNSWCFCDGLPWWLAAWSFHLLAVCQNEEDVFCFFEATNGCDDSD